MMNVLLVLPAKVMFSEIIEGANSEFFFACFTYMFKTSDLLHKFDIPLTFREKLAFPRI